MNNAIIVQTCWSVDNRQVIWQGCYYETLRLTLMRHSAYARAQKFDYWIKMGDIHPEYMTGAWSKCFLILEALEAGYQDVVYIDTDAAVMDFETDLRSALPEGKFIGAVLHTPDKSEFLKVNNVPPHYNVGVLYFRNSPRTIEFVKAWIATYPGKERWLEQGSFNDMVTGEYADMFHQVDDRFNATVNVNMTDKPAVKGWHGIMTVANRLAVMTEELADDFIKFRVL